MDFGTTPVYDKTFVITVPGASVSDVISVFEVPSEDPDMDIVTYTGLVTAVAGSMVTITASKRDNNNVLSGIECRTALAGITLTGATVETDGFAQIMSLNQLAVLQEKDWEFTNYPIYLRQNEGICLQNSGAIVAGTTISVSIQYSEV